MSNKNEEVNQRLASKLGTWHLDAWEEFTRLDEYEQEVWKHICTKGEYIPFKQDVIKERSTKRVLCLPSEVIYPSVKVAAQALNLTSRTIYYSINNNATVFEKYKFQYVEE